MPDTGTPEERLAELRARGQPADPRAARAASASGPGWARPSPPRCSRTPQLAIAHVGDSRAYLFRGGSLTASHAGPLARRRARRAGQAHRGARPRSTRSARSSPARSAPSRPSRSTPGPTRSATGTSLLLCSDGLTSMIGEERIAAILGDARDLRQAAGPADRRRPTTPAGATTSPSSCSGSRTSGDGAVDQPTMVGAARRSRRYPRRAARRRRPHRRPPAPPPAAPAPPGRPRPAGPDPGASGAPPGTARAAGAAARAGPSRWPRSLAVTWSSFLILAGGYLATPPAVLRRHQPAGHRHDLPRAALRPAGRDPPLRDLLRLRGAGGRRSRPTAGDRCSTTTCAPRRTRPASSAALELGQLDRMSARNRELFGLIPASLLVTAGFAGVFIQRSNALSNVSLTYGAIFLGAVRRRPRRDPDDAAPRRPVPVPAGRAAGQLRDRDGLPDRPDPGAPAGAVVRARPGPVRGDDRRLPGLPQARAVPLRDRVRARWRCWSCPALPGIGYQANGAYLGVRIPGLFVFQPAEFAKIGLVIFLASYLRDTRQVMVMGARRILGITFPPIKHFGPVLVIWGIAMVIMFLLHDIGSLADVLRRPARRALRRHGPAVVRRRRAGSRSRSAPGTSAPTSRTSTTAIEAWLHPFNPQLYNRDRRQLPAGQLDVRPGGRRASSARASARRR